MLEKDAHRSTIISRDGSPGYTLFRVMGVSRDRVRGSWVGYHYQRHSVLVLVYVGVVYGVSGSGSIDKGLVLLFGCTSESCTGLVGPAALTKV